MIQFSNYVRFLCVCVLDEEEGEMDVYVCTSISISSNSRVYLSKTVQLTKCTTITISHFLRTTGHTLRENSQHLLYCMYMCLKRVLHALLQSMMLHKKGSLKSSNLFQWADRRLPFPVRIHSLHVLAFYYRHMQNNNNRLCSS